MKRKNVSQPLTKADFESALKGVATKKDLEKYATKEDLNALEARLGIKLDKARRELDDNARKYKDEVLTSNDKLAKQLETIGQELGLENLQIKREVENHEKRIKHLEELQPTI